MKAKRIVSLALALLLLTCLLAVPVSAATVTKQTDFTYHDSIIKSWTVGKITGYYTYSYNPSTKKLINEKSLTYRTSKLAFACKFTDVSKKWDWYNTTDRNGSGCAVFKWRFGVGLTTQWVTIGSYRNDTMMAYVYGNGNFVRR
ncbi:MAG: hypothetical protein IJF40_06390 [Clostridia bacterium]|nr:hypothetical protein [Clostridia bacterium]